MKRGPFIVAEGVDGSGKSSNVRNLQSHLQGTDINHYVTLEPGGTKACQAIRAILKNQEQPLAARTEAMLFYAARIEHTEKIIRPYTERGYLVLSDRYYASSLAYQGAMADDVFAIHALSKDLILRPDLTLLYDIPIELLEERIAYRGEVCDSIEQRGVDYFMRVRENFLAMAKDDPTYIIIDATQPLTDVFRESIEHVTTFLEGWNEDDH